MSIQADHSGRIYQDNDADIIVFDLLGSWAEYCHKMRASFEAFQAGADIIVNDDERSYYSREGWPTLLRRVESAL